MFYIKLSLIIFNIQSSFLTTRKKRSYRN